MRIYLDPEPDPNPDDKPKNPPEGPGGDEPHGE